MGTSPGGSDGTPVVPRDTSAAAPLGAFRHGMNSGHVNASWTDNDDGWLGAQAGADSNRIKLPEYFLQQWGADIRVDAAKSYQQNGMSNLVCFLIGPSREHSSAPAGTPDWRLDEYMPTHLYEPIFDASGRVNPANTWAKYVETTVSTYKPWVRIWEVWNEPDWTPDWQVTKQWATRPPSKADLPRLHGSVFDYLRMLRVTYAVVKKTDPTAQVALGGIGYPTFLSALLRYTDNPDGGGVTAAYPDKGSAYFDVLNFHYYPLYTAGNSDAALAGMLKLKEEFAAELSKAGVSGKSWHITETGAPRASFAGTPGGADYARNYLLKVMLEAQLRGMLGIDWFLLSDGKAPGASQEPYDYMGLYEYIGQLKTKEEARKTSTGVAYSTLGLLLKGASVDAAASAALSLPAGIGGGAFKTETGRTMLALWAKADQGEHAAQTLQVQALGDVTAYAWDHAQTMKSATVKASNGFVQLSLTSTPQFFQMP